MNPKDIMMAARQSADPVYARLLWFLQSLALEDGGDKRFASETKQFVPNGDDDEDPVLEDLLGRHWASLRLDDLLNRLVERLGCRDIKTLFDYMDQVASVTIAGFHQTNIGREVWSTLDWCLEEHRPCFIEGREGRGKSASARAWFEAHRGESRYVSLPGLGQQSDFFKALADVYGVNYSAAKAPNQIRWRVRDAIVQSGLVLIIDEAHGALPERHRKGAPPLIDWLDRDVCNAGVAVCLISTPQFGPRLAEFEDRTLWNAGQFRRRFAGKWTALPLETTEADLAALAQKALPRVGSKGIKLAVGYALEFERDVSGMFDLVRDARRRARTSGRAEVTYPDLRDAYSLDRVPSENALAAAFKRPEGQQPGSPHPEDLQSHADRVAAPLPDASEAAAEPLQPSRTSPAATDFRCRTISACEADLVS